MLTSRVAWAEVRENYEGLKELLLYFLPAHSRMGSNFLPANLESKFMTSEHFYQRSLGQ